MDDGFPTFVGAGWADAGDCSSVGVSRISFIRLCSQSFYWCLYLYLVIESYGVKSGIQTVLLLPGKRGQAIAGMQQLFYSPQRTEFSHRFSASQELPPLTFSLWKGIVAWGGAVPACVHLLNKFHHWTIHLLLHFSELLLCCCAGLWLLFVPLCEVFEARSCNKRLLHHKILWMSKAKCMS